MMLGGGLVAGVPRATAIPALLFRSGRRSVHCCSYSSAPDHVTFIKDVAATQPPQHLTQLMRMLQAKGESIVSPGAKQGLIPLAIPLSKNNSGTLTALLRWPTAPPGMEMPVIEVNKHGVWPLAKSVDQFIHRILVEEDANSTAERKDEVFDASADAGEHLYSKGDFTKSNISSIDVYLLKKVGLFPDVLERRVMHHLKEGDHVRHLIRIGRRAEAKDAARGALKSPWWTLGCKYHDVAEIAEWEDEQIEFIKEKVTEEGRQEDLKKGKAPSQVLLDEAAFLLDLASVDGTWDDCLERIAECYEEGGLPDIARFILYRD